MTDTPLTPAKVARLFGVTAATVSDWADRGLLPSFRTPGGQRRFRQVDVDAFLTVRKGAPQ